MGAAWARCLGSAARRLADACASSVYGLGFPFGLMSGGCVSGAGVSAGDLWAAASGGTFEVGFAPGGCAALGVGSGFVFGSGGPRLTGVLAGGASIGPRALPLLAWDFPPCCPYASARPRLCLACPGGSPVFVAGTRPRGRMR
jgi:hypothetical protein